MNVFIIIPLVGARYTNTHPETPVTQQEVVMDTKRARISVRNMNISGVVMRPGLKLPLKTRNNSVKSIASSLNVIAVNETVDESNVLSSGTNRFNKVKKMYK